MIFFYNILYFLAFIFYVPVLFIRGKLHRGFVQRLGFLGQELPYRFYQKKNIWFHAVSVGEILAIVGLVERIRSTHPDHQIVISTVTPTGYALAQKRFRKEDIVIFAPLDFGWAVKSFIKRMRPEIFIAAETEIWPNLLTVLARADVPMVMVNGRISNKSFYGYRRFQFFIRKVLRPFRAFCMQSACDADRIINLGASAKNVFVLGSMKFDEGVSGEEITLARCGFKNEALVWVAGSTHPGEEKIVLDIFKKLKKKFFLLSLVIAPRHIERSPEICDLIKAEGLTAAVFSRINPPGSDPQAVVVVDTIGHLKSLYRLATVVFVGKSLTGNGGQNIIEPAFFAKPVIVGPHMQNFADIAEIFLEAGAILQIETPDELREAVSKLLASPELRTSLGERALATIKKNAGATHGTERIISGILGEIHFHKPQ